MSTGTPARSPLLILSTKRRNNRGTSRRQSGSLFPQLAGGAKETAHAQSNPQRAHPLEHIITDTSAQTRLHRHVCTGTPAYPIHQAAKQPKPPHRKAAPLSHNRQAVQRKRRTPKATPNGRIRINGTCALNEPKQSNIQSPCRLLSESRLFYVFSKNIIDFSCST